KIAKSQNDPMTRCLLILSRQSSPAENHQIQGHVQGIPQIMHFGGRVVIPAHRDLHHLAPQALDQEEDFRIESESFHALEFEGAASGFAPEEFEATLCVMDSKAGENPDQQIEE